MKKFLAILAALMLAALNVSAQEELYAIFDYKDSVLTLYFGRCNNCNGSIDKNDFYPTDCIRKIVIDSTVKNYWPKSYKNFFRRCDSVEEIVGLKYLNPPLDGDMSEMFANCANVETLDLEGFDTHGIKNMAGMFYGCKKLKKIDLSGFDTEMVTNLAWMFKGCISIDSLDLRSFDTRSVYRMEDMFEGCSNLKSVDVSSFNTENIVVMCGMFANCTSLKTIDLSNFTRWREYTRYSNIDKMFSGCHSLSTIYASCNWNMDGFEDFGIFTDCYSLYGGQGTHYIGYSNGDEYARIDKGAECPGYFTLKGQPLFWSKAYTVLKDSVLTFRYSDTKPIDNDYYLLGGYCNNNSKIKTVVFDKSLKKYYPKSCANWFSGFNNLIEIIGMNEYLNTDSVTDMQKMFYGCNSIKTVDLSEFNTSDVRKMSSMFEDCHNLQTIFVDGDWKTDSVVSSKYMFAGCWNLYGGQGTKYKWVDGNNEFGSGNEPIKYAHIDGGEDNPGFLTAIGQQPYEPPTTKEESEVEVIQNHKPIDYSHLFSPVIDSLAYAVLKDSVLTFYYGGGRPEDAFEIKSYKPLYNDDLPNEDFIVDKYDLNVRTPKWNTRSNEIKRVVFDSTFKNFRPTSCYEWFSRCCNLTEIVGMKENLNTEDVVYMSAMFLGCIKLKNIDLSGFYTQKVKTMHSMFSCCESIESLDLSNFKTDSLKSTVFMFDNCTNLKYLNLNGFNTSNVKNMGSMFYGCKSLETIDLSGFNIDNCENMSFMFAESGIKQIDLSGFQFKESKAHNFMEGLFMNCKNLKSLDISHFKNVGYGKGMFFGCSNLKDLKLFAPCFDDDDEYYFGDFTGLFYGCESLEELDLSVLKRVGCPLMSYMFANCFNLKTIFVDNDWNYHFATPVYYDGSSSEQYACNTMETTDIFKNCYNLVGGCGTKYSPANKSNFLYAQIDYGDGSQGYFTKKTPISKSNHKSKVWIPAQSKEITYFDDVERKYVEISKWGFVNQNGEWIVTPKYDKVEKYNNDGYAKVFFNGQSKYIDKDGNYVDYEGKKDETGQHNWDSGNVKKFKVIQENGRYGYIKDETDTIVKPMFDYAWNFDRYGYAQIKDNGKFGFIDTLGAIVVEPIFDVVKEEYWEDCLVVSVMIDGKWCFFNKKGHYVFELNADEVCSFDKYGFARVKIDGKWGFIDTAGKYTIEPIIELLSTSDNNCYLSVMIDGKWGVVDSTRRIVVQPQFEDVDCYMLENFGLAPAKINGKWGYVNAKGKWIIKPKFDWAYKFYNSYTTIKLNERQGIINKKGKYYLFPSEPAFDDIEERDFDHLPYARISKRNKYNYDKIGLVDKKGNILIEPKFAKIKFFKGVILAKEAYNGKWGIIDKRGNWIQKPIFIEIGNEYDWYYD